jgi:hypothetical protein
LNRNGVVEPGLVAHDARVFLGAREALHRSGDQRRQEAVFPGLALVQRGLRLERPDAVLGVPVVALETILPDQLVEDLDVEVVEADVVPGQLQAGLQGRKAPSTGPLAGNDRRIDEKHSHEACPGW